MAARCSTCTGHMAARAYGGGGGGGGRGGRGRGGVGLLSLAGVLRCPTAPQTSSNPSPARAALLTDVKVHGAQLAAVPLAQEGLQVGGSRGGKGADRAMALG